MKRERGSEGATAGLAAVMFGTVAWGSTGIFVKKIPLAALPLTFYRLWLGVFILGALLLVRRRPLNLAVLARSVLAGLFLAADLALFFSALKLTSVAVATVIGALQPVLVLVVAGRLFGERVGWRVVVWTVVSIGGIVAVALGPGVPRGEHLTGDALAVGSLVAFTGYWLVSKRVIGMSADSDRYTFAVMLVAAVAMTPVAFCCGEHLGPVRLADWWLLALLALVPGAGHLLFNFAHRFVDISVSSVVSAGNPIIASVLALLVLGEPLDAVQVVGGIIAVLAIAAVALQGADPGRTRRPAVSRRMSRSVWPSRRRRGRFSVPLDGGADKLKPEAWPGRQGERAVLESGFMADESCPSAGNDTAPLTSRRSRRDRHPGRRRADHRSQRRRPDRRGCC
jgi:drug/metabolite transporter (DMT)-like permease